MPRNGFREKHREVYNTCQDAEKTNIKTKELDTVRPKFFNVCSVRLVLCKAVLAY